MIVEDYVSYLKRKKIRSFYGVPDSVLKVFCNYLISAECDLKNHIVASNEGNAIGLAAGDYLATGMPALVYMQNSGLGNCINPLVSLMHEDVYSIPVLLLIGWRGEPGTHDEPQHMKQGHITKELLELLNIKYEILSNQMDKAKNQIDGAVDFMFKNKSPFALLVRKNTFSKKEFLSQKNKLELNREQCISIIYKSLDKNSIIVSTTGKTSRELFEMLDKKYFNSFFNVGAMGHTSQIALGISLKKNNIENIVCLDGDGAAIMHLGAMGIVGQYGQGNFKHIILNNGVHESVGGIKTVGHDIDFCRIALACGYKSVKKINCLDELEKYLPYYFKLKGPSLLEIMIKPGARGDLGRPDKELCECKELFMDYLKNE